VTLTQMFAETGYKNETISWPLACLDGLNAVFTQWQQHLACYLLVLSRPGLYRDSKFKHRSI